MITEETLEFLEHYGVKGQKWGVRRKNSRGSKSVDTSKLSNQELSKLVKRMQLDKSYNDVVKAPKQRTEGKAYAHNLLKSVGTTVVTSAFGAAVAFGVQKALKSKFDTPVKVKPKVPIPILPTSNAGYL